MATLRDVAKHAKVDKSTASRVLNGNVEKTSDATRRRILLAAKRFNYRPNAVARSLRVRRTNTVALMLLRTGHSDPYSTRPPELGNVGYGNIVQGVLEAADEAGSMVLLSDIRDPMRTEDVYERMVLEGHVDGVIVLVAFADVEDPIITRLRRHHAPVVWVNRQVGPFKGSAVIDEKALSKIAIEHLVELGHRRIGHIAVALNSDIGRRRAQAFRDTMADQGLKVDESWVVDGFYTEEGGRAAARDFLSRSRGRRPTALIAANLISALGAVAQFQDAGLKVPEDVSVVAMGDHPIADRTNPPLTTVAMPLHELGRQAVQMLIDAVNGKRLKHLVVSDRSRLVVRTSTGPPRSD